MTALAFTIIDAMPATPVPQRRGGRKQSLAVVGKRSRKNHVWTDAEREIVRRDYQGTHESAQRIAARLGVTEYGVRGQVYKLGLGKITDRQKWTPEQDERLEELIVRYPAHIVARRMGRGVNSVVIRAKRLGLSRRVRDGWYTKTEVAEICGVEHKRVQRWMDDGWLKAKPHGKVTPQKDGQAMWHIAEADLRTFLTYHAGDLNGRNVDLVQIVEILTTVAPVPL